MGGIGVPGAHPFKNTAPAVPTKMILGEVLMNPPVFIFTYNRRGSGARPEVNLFADGIVCCSRWCTPGMGVNLWGESPLYMNPVPSFMMVAKVLAEGKGVTVRWGLKEAGVQSYEPTDRNSI